MKLKVLIIITFANISSVICQTTIDSLVKQKQNIEIQEIDIDCLYNNESYFVIRNEKEYKKYECLSEVDFDKYSIIGFYTGEVKGCKRPICEYDFYKENGNYYMDIIIIQNGLCERFFYVWKWFLIPKLFENENVIFNINMSDSVYIEEQNPQIIEISDLDISCSGFKGNPFIIRNEKEYEMYSCYNSSKTKIDFDKYSIIGFSRGGLSGCKKPNYEYNFYKEGNNYYMDINIIQNGFCEANHFLGGCFLIPKLLENENVIFNLKVSTLR